MYGALSGIAPATYFSGDQKNKLQKLIAQGNLTFFKDYANSQASQNADFSIGSATGTFSCTRGAGNPASFTTSAGVITTTTTSDVPRWMGGYYDSSGFVSKPGLIMERTSSNLVPDSADMTNVTWTASNVNTAADSIASPDGGTNADTVTASAGNGTLLLTTAVTAQAFSVFLQRKTGSGNIQITANSGSSWTTVTVPTGSWARFQVSAASASQTCGIRIVTSGDAVYMWGAQFENQSFASSYIPTSAGAKTRNGETLTYPIASNRTAASESIFIKFYPQYSYSGSALPSSALMDTDTKSRFLGLSNIDNAWSVRANATDNSTVKANSTFNTTAFTSYVLAGVIQHSSPYVEQYFDAVSKATYTVGDFTDPVWGTNFYIAVNNAAGSMADSIIQSVTIYSDAKVVGAVINITNILNT